MCDSHTRHFIQLPGTSHLARVGCWGAGSGLPVAMCYGRGIVFFTSYGNLQNTQAVKNLPTMQETWVRSLGGEEPLEEGMATHSSILAWRIPCTEEPGGLQSIGSQRVGHNWASNSFFIDSFLRFKQVKWLSPIHISYCQGWESNEAARHPKPKLFSPQQVT